jgi:drug/metabolite transporter (DMT)-like permease
MAPLLERMGRGIAFMCGAVAVFSIMATLVKWLGPHYPLVQLMFFRNALALPAGLAIVLGSGGFAQMRTRHLWGHLFRAATGVSAMATGFFALSVLPLADATAISFTNPLFVTMLAIPLLGEKVGLHRWSAVGFGFLGVVVLAWGLSQDGGFGGGSALGMAGGLANALLSAVSALLVRRLSATESSAAISLWQSLFATGITVCLLPFGWVWPPLADVPLLCGIGLCGGVAQFWLTQAYRYAPASVAGPFTYTAMVWAILIGWVVWADVPTPTMLLGSAIVVASGLYILHREVFRAKQQQSALPAAIAKRDRP